MFFHGGGRARSPPIFGLIARLLIWQGRQAAVTPPIRMNRSSQGSKKGFPSIALEEEMLE